MERANISLLNFTSDSKNSIFTFDAYNVYKYLNGKLSCAEDACTGRFQKALL